MQNFQPNHKFEFGEYRSLLSKQKSDKEDKEEGFRAFLSVLNKAPRSHEEIFLPIRITEGGRKKQYVWNGKKIVRREIDGTGHRHSKLQDLITAAQDARHTVVRAFFPKRNEVTRDYWAFVTWRAGHRLSSAMLGNFATQSLLAAVGVGAKQQLPAAASINWLLKDGLGRLGRLCVAACLGHKFDSELKRYRYVTSLIFTGATALEFMAPLMPQHFLILASMANIGKAVGITTYVATHPAFMRSFARGDNLADINAKGQAQQMVMDTLGLALCVALTFGVRNSSKGRLLLPLISFPFLAAVDLLCIFKELKATHLRSLNQERAELLAEEWFLSGDILTPQKVSAKEQLMLPHLGSSVFHLPLKFVAVDKLATCPEELLFLLKQYRKQNYLLKVGGVESRLHVGPLQQTDCIAVALREGAGSQDVIAAVLQAEILRHAANLKAALERQQVDGERQVLASCVACHDGSPLLDFVHSSLGYQVLQDNSIRLAAEFVKPFCNALQEASWQTDGFLIPPHQKEGFIAEAMSEVAT